LCEFLYINQKMKMGEISYQKRQKFRVKDRKGLEERAKDVLERYLELEQILNIATDFSLSFMDRSIQSNEDVEKVAFDLRKAWKLGNDPIFNLIELLEDNKIKVIEIESADTFDGLSAWANDGTIPVIVLNKINIKSLDRIRFTALHELGHLILNLDGYTEKQKEK